MAPCVNYSQLDQDFWDLDSSFFRIDSMGNVDEHIQGVHGDTLMEDSFHIVRVGDSLFRISPLGTHLAISIRIKALQDHLMVLEYIADPFHSSFGLDSLIR